MNNRKYRTAQGIGHSMYVAERSCPMDAAQSVTYSEESEPRGASASPPRTQTKLDVIGTEVA
jgi:hypothetical protein